MNLPNEPHTIVRPRFFADAYLLLTALGDSRNAPPSNEDIARVAVAALTDPARHAGKSYRPTCPKLLAAKEMAEAIGQAVGRSVRVVPTPTWLFMKTARMGGLSIDLISGVRYFVEDQIWWREHGDANPNASIAEVRAPRA